MSLSTVDRERLNLFYVQPDEIGLVLTEDNTLLYTDCPGLIDALVSAGIVPIDEKAHFCG